MLARSVVAAALVLSLLGRCDHEADAALGAFGEEGDDVFAHSRSA